MVPIDLILPSRRTPPNLDISKKYNQIRSSIEEIGLIEPLSVRPAADTEAFEFSARPQ